MMSNTLSSPGLSYQMLNVKFAAIMQTTSVFREQLCKRMSSSAECRTQQKIQTYFTSYSRVL